MVNPPRRGIGEQLATRIEASGVERVLYSSCNPRTLAADLAHLPSMRVVRSRLFDMFPHTEHAEVLAKNRPMLRALRGGTAGTGNGPVRR